MFIKIFFKENKMMKKILCVLSLVVLFAGHTAFADGVGGFGVSGVVSSTHGLGIEAGWQFGFTNAEITTTSRSLGDSEAMTQGFAPGTVIAVHDRNHDEFSFDFLFDLGFGFPRVLHGGVLADFYIIPLDFCSIGIGLGGGYSINYSSEPGERVTHAPFATVEAPVMLGTFKISLRCDVLLDKEIDFLFGLSLVSIK
jgi:hypothetical protein